MTGYIKKPYKSILIRQLGCGKTRLVLEWLKKNITNILICVTLRENDTYHAKEWIKNDDKVWLVDPKDNLYQWIKKLSELLRFLEVLIINDIIANESLDKRRQPLLELSISGRHRGHYLWLLTQSYSAIPKNLRRQAKTIFVWYLKERADLKMMHDENDVLTDDELVVARSFLKKSKHACLYIQNEYPRGFRLLNHAWGAYFKWVKKGLINICYPSLHLLWQSWQSLNTVIPSSADLTCFAIENILLLPHWKQVYKEFSKVSCGFSSCLITRFTISLAKSKTGCSKIGSISTFFPCTLK